MYYDIRETIDGRYLVLANGFQWGEPPFDASGCSSETFESKEEACSTIVERMGSGQPKQLID